MSVIMNLTVRRKKNKRSYVFHINQRRMEYPEKDRTVSGDLEFEKWLRRPTLKENPIRGCSTSCKQINKERKRSLLISNNLSGQPVNE